MTCNHARQNEPRPFPRSAATHYHFENSFAHDCETQERMKLAFLISLLFILALIWAPIPFKKQVIAPPTVVKEPLSPVTLKPPPLRPERPVEISDKKRKLVPVPDRTPTQPEIAPTPEVLPEPDLILTDFDMAFEPGDPPAKGDAIPLTTPGLERPVIVKRAQPNYPERGVRVGMQGYVMLEALLKADGTIDAIKILRGLGRGKLGFEQAAMDAVKEWEFLPAKLDGRPVDVYLNLKIDFVLNRR